VEGSAMPPMSLKNKALNINDIGLGDLLGQQTEDEIEEMRKKALRRVPGGELLDQRVSDFRSRFKDLAGGGGPMDILGGFFGR